MSTKGTQIPEWLKVPFAGITPAPTQEKGQDLFPTGNWRSITAGVPGQAAALQQRLRHE